MTTTTVFSLLHESPDGADTRQTLERRLEPLLVAGELWTLVARAPNPAADLASKIVAALDSSLGKLVETVWAEQHDVRVAIEHTRREPAVALQVPLLHERVTVTDRLRVDVDGIEQWELEPTLTLALDIRSLIVTVEGGRITKVGPLDADATAQLKLGNHELLTGKTTPVKLRSRKIPVGSDAIDLREPGSEPAWPHAGQAMPSS